MTDTTEPRDPRVDPPVSPTPTVPGEVSENPPCFLLDPYGWEVACDTPDPCLTDLGQTLYSIQPCGANNPPIDEWCATRPGHPACLIVVEVGEPPIPPALPATGTGFGGSMILAAIVVAVGGVLSAIARLKR